MKKCNFVLGFLFLTLFGVSAQLINPSNLNLQSLNSTQLGYFNNIDSVKGALFIFYNIIEFDDLSNANINGEFIVQTGFDDCGGMPFKITYLDYVDDDNYILLAEIIDENLQHECTSGSIQFYADSTVRYGKMSYNGKSFEVFDLGNDVGLLAEVNPDIDGCEVLEGDVGHMSEPMNMSSSTEGYL